MPTLDQLIVRLDADLKPLELALARAEKLTENFVTRMANLFEIPGPQSGRVSQNSLQFGRQGS